MYFYLFFMIFFSVSFFCFLFFCLFFCSSFFVFVFVFFSISIHAVVWAFIEELVAPGTYGVFLIHNNFYWHYDSTLDRVTLQQLTVIMLLI